MIALCVLAGCGPRVSANKDAGEDPTGDGPPVGTHTLTGLEVTPTNPIIELDLNTPGTQAFMVRGIYADGVDEDLTTTATLEVVNPAVGALNGATLMIP